MTEQNTEDERIVAALPVVYELGLLPYRTVISDLADEHFVDSEVLELVSPTGVRVVGPKRARPLQGQA